MNERESEALACRLTDLGYKETLVEDDADIIILNTCSVREQAERKAIGKAGILKRLLKKNPNLVTGIIGCMAQNKGQRLFELIPHLNFVAGTEQLHQVPSLIERALNGETHIFELGQNEPVFHECPGHRQGEVVAMTSVMRGCNQFCTYCIVPYTRGRERSREISAIVDEVTMLAEHGTKEILLLGQNITAYGLVEARANGTYTPEISPFADLLEAVNAIPGLERIRFTSPHVKYMNDKFIETICRLPKVCKSFHIPLQSGADRILKLMHRTYTSSDFMARIDAIKSRLPEVAFSTDVIVGFPGETEEEFGMTRSLMQEVGFDMAYIFRYSPREGTKSAETMPDDVPDDVKHERNQILLADLEAYAARRNSEFKGRVLPVLVEGVSKRNGAKWTGRTDLNKTCNFAPVPGVEAGDMVDLRITRCSANSLGGEIVGKRQ